MSDDYLGEGGGVREFYVFGAHADGEDRYRCTWKTLTSTIKSVSNVQTVPFKWRGSPGLSLLSSYFIIITIMMYYCDEKITTEMRLSCEISKSRRFRMA